MAAVANNPEFAANAGVPRSIGASFMAKDKKVKKYQAGNLVDMAGEETSAKLAGGVGSVLGFAPAGMADAGEGTRGPNPDELPSEVMQEEQREYLRKLEEAQKPKKKKKKKQKKMGGGMLKYAHGGKVRGAGCARRGVRKAKMVTMKGA